MGKKRFKKEERQVLRKKYINKTLRENPGVGKDDARSQANLYVMLHEDYISQNKKVIRILG